MSVREILGLIHFENEVLPKQTKRAFGTFMNTTARAF